MLFWQVSINIVINVVKYFDFICHHNWQDCFVFQCSYSWDAEVFIFVVCVFFYNFVNLPIDTYNFIIKFVRYIFHKVDDMKPDSSSIHVSIDWHIHIQDFSFQSTKIFWSVPTFYGFLINVTYKDRNRPYLADDIDWRRRSSTKCERTYRMCNNCSHNKCNNNNSAKQVGTYLLYQ